MKRYEFHSSLTPEQVFAKLDAYARPWDTTAFGDGTFRFKRKKDRFYLGCTGTLPARGFLPFRGEVRAEEGGSVIAGGFYVRAVWNVMLVGFGFAYMMLRLENPELNLNQLAALCDPAVSKSAFNHRMRKLMELAEGPEHETV